MTFRGSYTLAAASKNPAHSAIHSKCLETDQTSCQTKDERQKSCEKSELKQLYLIPLLLPVIATIRVTLVITIKKSYQVILYKSYIVLVSIWRTILNCVNPI